jgi:hypothetical protein
MESKNRRVPMSKAIVLHSGLGKRALAGYLGYEVGRALSSGIDLSLAIGISQKQPSGPSGPTAEVVRAKYF